MEGIDGGPTDRAGAHSVRHDRVHGYSGGVLRFGVLFLGREDVVVRTRTRTRIAGTIVIGALMAVLPGAMLAAATRTVGPSGVPVSQPRISLSDVIVGEYDGYADMVVSLSAPGQNPVSVDFATSNGTANAQSPSTTTSTSSGTLNFAPGETTKVGPPPDLDGASPEGFESFYFVSRRPRSTRPSPRPRAVGIVDNDTVVDTPRLFVRDAVVDEKAGSVTCPGAAGRPHGRGRPTAP